jgi:hypothetical protein
VSCGHKWILGGNPSCCVVQLPMLSLPSLGIPCLVECSPSSGVTLFRVRSNVVYGLEVHGRSTHS